jgi:fructose PTS system EIIBC or EIIC component
MAGSAATGALSMIFNSTLRAPHGGIFVLPIPNAVGNLGSYILAIVVGTVLTAVIVNILKPNLELKQNAGMSEHKTETSL